MCRLIGFSNREPAKLTDYRQVLADFLPLSQIHKDGWGATNGHEVIKAPKQLASDDFWPQAEQLSGTELFIHLRQASRNIFADKAAGKQDSSQKISVALPKVLRYCDTHPWLAEGTQGQFAFCHNGHIFDETGAFTELARSFDPNLADDAIDSVKFLAIVTALLAEYEPAVALAKAVELIEHCTTYLALNALLISDDGLFAMSAANPTLDEWRVDPMPSVLNYQLQEACYGDFMVVSSNGWMNAGPSWIALPNRQVRHYRAGQLVDELALPSDRPGVDPVPMVLRQARLAS